jgi:solute carrier family 25 phosphate transporter 3
MASPAKSTGSTQVDAVVQNVKANQPGAPTGFALYSRFALAGAVCCSVTHGGMTPVDVYVVLNRSPARNPSSNTQAN